MSNFEQRYMDWLDRRPAADIPTAPETDDPAAVEAEEWRRMRDRVREVWQPAPMPHGDFMNSQVLAAISRETAPRETRPRARWRLIFAGATLVCTAGVIGLLALSAERASSPGDRFISQVIDARSADPKLGAYAFAAPGGRGAVLWIQDAGYIPANEKIK